MAEEAKPKTAADVAKLVHRTVGEKKVAVKAEDLLTFKDYGTHVVAVTRDGQKLVSGQAE